MIIPSIKSSLTIYDFFSHFYETNKEKDSKFSYGFIANALNWPPSLVPDLLKKRKTFNVRRTLELTKWLNLDVFDTELLILLCLKDHNSEAVQSYSKEKISSQFNPSHLKRNKPQEKKALDLTARSILAALTWKSGSLSVKEIMEQLHLIPDLNESNCNEYLNWLENEGLIQKQTDGNYKSVKTEEMWELVGVKDPNSEKNIGEYCENLMAFLKHHNYPYTLSNEIVILPLNKRKEYFERLLMLRNWLYKISEETKESCARGDKDNLVFQMGLHLFPIVPSNKDHIISNYPSEG